MEGAMQKQEFEQRIRALIPVVSDKALSNFVELSEDPEVKETMGSSDFLDSMYVDLALVKRDYGVDIAAELFNYGAQYTFNPYELRGAAGLMAEGWAIDQIADHLIERGFDPPFCEYTPEEEAESEALLWLFKSGKEALFEQALSAPPEQGPGMEMR